MDGYIFSFGVVVGIVGSLIILGISTLSSETACIEVSKATKCELVWTPIFEEIKK